MAALRLHAPISTRHCSSSSAILTESPFLTHLPLLRHCHRTRLRSSTRRSRYLLPLRRPSSIRTSVQGFRVSGSSPLEGRNTGEEDEDEMTIAKSSITISQGRLAFRNRTVLTGVPESVMVTDAVDGVFLGAKFPEPACRHVVSLGTLRGIRFSASFRFKMWWMAHMTGDRGGEIPFETQFLLLELKGNEDEDDDHGGEIVYIVFLPLIDGAFRSSLQGGAGDDVLELCIESGDDDTVADASRRALFVGASTSDPFSAVSGAVTAVRSQLGTFRRRPEKRLPGIVDCFGWCTWDAFYQEVTQEGVEAGLQSLLAGGTPPRFVIIDDGWQSVACDDDDIKLPRLNGIKENGKFRIGSIVKKAKEEYGLKYVYLWHAIIGYWGGVWPGAEGMEQYHSKLRHPKVSQGVMENEPGLKTDVLTTKGVGLPDPESVYRFYDDLHGYLAGAGVDGVKVDVQCALEALGDGLSGRVELARRYHRALDASVAKNFPDNGCIACMSHNTDSLYCSKQTAIVRASDDFYPKDPVSHTIHITSVAYNSVFLGEFMLPDWDMFHSLHPAAAYHASARAISGGPIYVSDAPGKHDFVLLRKLVLPDGSVLRPRLPGRPTLDCLFSDPARDGVSLLKIWNMNKYTGVLGVYNCQGAAWSSVEKKNMFIHHTGAAEARSASVKPSDVHLISEAAASAMEEDWSGDCAIYCHRSGELVVLSRDAAVLVSLKVLEHEIFTLTPIKDLASGFRFAPLGLVDMFNSGGAIEALSYQVLRGGGGGGGGVWSDSDLSSASGDGERRSSEAVGLVCMEVKGCGRFGAYSSSKPRKCSLGSVEAEFAYDAASGFLSLQLKDMPVGDLKVHKVVIEL